VVTVDPGQSLQHAAQLMQEHGIGSVVVEQGAAAGVLSVRDVMSVFPPRGGAPAGGVAAATGSNCRSGSSHRPERMTAIISGTVVTLTRGRPLVRPAATSY
jgi:CBS domain-containing protein